VDASSFRCVVILSLYLTLDFVIPSLIVGTFKPVSKTLLDVYHGAFIMFGGLYFDIAVIFQCLNYCTPESYTVCPVLTYLESKLF
jgi:hypothetical protein